MHAFLDPNDQRKLRGNREIYVAGLPGYTKRSQEATKSAMKEQTEWQIDRKTRFRVCGWAAAVTAV